jgi:hypothetical protein
MRREFDLLAISLLMFAVTLITAMATDPKGFSIQAWQPLMAALVALGGASIVYRGATLAYQAAMAKVALDHEQAERERLSERLGLFLRLTTSLYSVIGDTAGHIYKIEERREENAPFKSMIITPRELKIFNPPELSDAWAKVHLLPHELITDIAFLREQLDHFQHDQTDHNSITWTIDFDSLTAARCIPDYLKAHSQRCKLIQSSCEKVIDRLEKVLPTLRRFD